LETVILKELAMDAAIARVVDVLERVNELFIYVGGRDR
jgi:hypothetical protein